MTRTDVVDCIPWEEAPFQKIIICHSRQFPHYPLPRGSPTLSPSAAAAAAVVLPPISGPAGSPSSSVIKGTADPYVVIKELEHRLHSVEEAYTALRQHTQKLQQIQVSQDRTIGWMRERLEQMTDVAAAASAGHGRRGIANSSMFF
ncbi:hypothetical protein BGX24_000271 [Mortierella sp. AD032]|nr:hypothetical protein BGX24_000271 [Mortierella sp. AD032]